MSNSTRAAFVAVFLLSGCNSSGDQPKTPPPAIVQTEVVRYQTVPNIGELPGRIQAVRSAEVRARTDGIVQRRLYEEGSIVKAGQPLFQIDPRDYRAQVEQAQGTLQRALALRNNAQQVVRRYDPLVSQRAISGQEYDSARSDLAQAEAQVTEGRAALARAQLQLDYTTIRAPIAGRVGRGEVTEGALVSASQATLMTRVDQISPVYAVFSESSSAILTLQQQARTGELKLSSPSAVTVELVLENGSTYPVAGRVDFTDTTVDPTTGSQTIRAQFDNVGGLLAPGQFVRGRLEAGTITNGIKLPARAIQFKGDQASVSVLGKDGTVITRPVTLGSLAGQYWIIRSGVMPSERVIVEGWQKARPGQKAMDARDAKKAQAAAAKQGG
ncbi:MAG TPA: efflux RND transporter periplasmic adaptor subunit [Sphingobium sp.]|uniref:efflux RND transporter periplasmic adaptor subunit n=1 Tax=Sphingobium sp. TaxID=1912891 RepID=UPI002ED4A1B8